MPLLYQPGTHWHYGFAHDVQARLVEVLSGMPFDVYCRKAIFGPLGMKDTGFGVPPGLKARFASIYHPDADGRILPGDGMGGDGDSYAAATGRPFGGTSIATTAGDYLRFAQMLLNGGRLGPVRILSRKTVELMTQITWAAHPARLARRGLRPRGRRDHEPGGVPPAEFGRRVPLERLRDDRDADRPEGADGRDRDGAVPARGLRVPRAATTLIYQSIAD